MMHWPVRRRRAAWLMMVAAVVSTTAALLFGTWSLPSGLANQSPGSSRGAHLYTQHCQVCHGLAAQGRLGPPLVPVPPAIAVAPRPAVVLGLVGLLRAGVPGAMPSFRYDQLTDDDVAALTDYLFEMSDRAPAGSTFAQASLPIASLLDTPERRYFSQTGHSLAGAFKIFWERNGAARLFGSPLTEEYTAIGDDGQPVTVQLFERARFEYRPRAPDSVQLSRLGADERWLRTRFGGP
jgi:mono/diheme cytochrome c family protein